MEERRTFWSSARGARCRRNGRSTDALSRARARLFGRMDSDMGNPRGWEEGLREETWEPPASLSALRSQSQSGLAISRGEQGDSKRWGRGASHELRIPFAGLAAPGNVGVLPLLNLKSRVLSVCKDSNPTMECCRFKQECGEEATEGPLCF